MILQFTKSIEINQLKMNLRISEWYQEHPEKEAKVHHVLYVTPTPPPPPPHTKQTKKEQIKKKMKTQ